MAKNKNNLSAKEKRDMAYDLYMNTDKTQVEICDVVDWSERTFSENKKKGNWDELKSAMELTSQKIIVNIYRRLQDATKEGVKLDSDAIIKLAKSIEHLSDRKVTISNIINVFKEFTSWLMNEDPELAKTINELQKKYVVYKING